MARVVVCGNVVWDMLVRPVTEPLRWGTTTFVQDAASEMGGNASSTSYALGRLGATVTIASLLGHDPAGTAIRERLASVGVDLGMLQTTPQATSTAVSLVHESGARALLYALGASAAEFRLPLQWPADTAHFHLAAVYRMQHLRRVGPALLQQAREAGLTTSLDTQWDTEGEWMRVLAPSLPWCDYTFLNDDEARAITGHSEPADAARVLRDHGATHVVIKLGARGCWIDGDVAPGYPVQAIDTTGAGDCFVGGFLAAKQRGLNDRDAARLANAVGALSVQRMGATAGLRNWEDTQAWILDQPSSS